MRILFCMTEFYSHYETDLSRAELRNRLERLMYF